MRDGPVPVVIASEDVWQSLDRNVAIKSRVAGAVDLAHAAAADRGENCKSAESTLPRCIFCSRHGARGA